MTVDAASVGHRHGDGYAAGDRSKAGAQGPAEGKAGDGAHASAAGDLLSHGAAHGAGGKRGQRQIRKYTLHGRLFPQPLLPKISPRIANGETAGGGKRA